MNRRSFLGKMCGAVVTAGIVLKTECLSGAAPVIEKFDMEAFVARVTEKLTADFQKFFNRELYTGTGEV